jgi:hypothetical protein
MNLKEVDWGNAQSLLIEIVKVLSPLAVKRVPASLFLNRRFLSPTAFLPEEEPLDAHHSLQILSTLRKTQERVEGWVGKSLEGEGGDQPQALAKEAKQLIEEVRAAIGKLSSSKFMQNPEDKLIYQTFIKLKPSLDRIVQAMHDEIKNQAPLKFVKLPSVPTSARSQFLQTLLREKNKKKKGFFPEEESEEETPS